MIAAGRSLSLVSALVALALLVIMETSVVTSYSAFVSGVQLKRKGDGEEVPEVFDGKRNASDSEKRQIIRLPLLPGRHQDRDRRSINTADETINEYERNGGYRRKSEGNKTASGNKAFSPSDMSAVVSEGAKKNHKKLKLAQMQGKNSRIKEYSRDRGSGKSIGDRSLKEISKRHVDYNTDDEAAVINNRNRISVDQAKQNRNADYYARRRAVMEKYYARQQEIKTKYTGQRSTTARPINRYNLFAEINTNNVSSPVNVGRRRLYEEKSAAGRYNGLGANSYDSFATNTYKEIRDTGTWTPPPGEDNGQNDEYYDTYEDDIETTQSPQSTQSTQSTQSIQRTQSTQNTQSVQSTQSTQNTQSVQSTQSIQIQHAPQTNIERGNCLQGTLVYQHNLNLLVNRASSVETDIQVSTDEWHCISCISVQSPKKIISSLSIVTTKGSSGGQNTVKLTAASIQEEDLHLVIKIFIAQKRGDHCNTI